MPEPQMVMFAEEFHQIQGIVDSLVKSSNASVVFIIDKNTTLGLVRLRVKKACEQLGEIFRSLAEKAQHLGQTPFAEITDDDIDNLFND